MLTERQPAGGPDLESSLSLTGADVTGADGGSLPDESPPAQLPAPKSVWSLASKSSAIVVTVCLLAWLANLVLAGSYLYEGWGQRILVSEIEATLDSIAELPESGEAQIRLTEAELALEAERGAFSSLASSPEVTQGLLVLAESVGLTIVEVVTEPGDPEKLGQNTYGAVLVSLQVAGSAGALAAFLYELEDGVLLGGRVDEVSIEKITPSRTGTPEDRSPQDGNEDSVPGWSSHTVAASVAVTVYERQGSWD